MWLSEAKRKALERAQSYFRKANLHQSTIRWRDDCKLNQAFYNGSDNGQWREEDLRVLEERGQYPITVNVTQGFVDNLSGVETQSRYRVACRADSDDPEEEKLASALTHWLFHIQEDQNIPYKGSQKFRDMLVTGIGWSNQYRYNNHIYYDYVPCNNVIPDPDNLDPQYEGMKYVCRKRWMEPEKVRAAYPHVSQYVNFDPSYLTDGISSPELMDRQSNYTDINTYAGYLQNRVLIIEVQERVPKKAYSGIDKNGRYFKTFDEEKAEKMVNSSKEIKEEKSERIMRTLFMDNFLLEHAPLYPDLPDMQSFSYIPCVWKRRYLDGVPYGIQECIRDLAINCNVRTTKSMYLINSSRMVISGNIYPGESTEKLRQELKRNDSVIILPPDTEYKIESNATLGKEQMDIVKECLVLMQRAVGVHDEMLGIQTNATSAIGQNVRQINSVRNNVYGFDNFANMKSKEARFFLDMIQSGEMEDIDVPIFSEQEKDVISLNLMREIDGEQIFFNDVRTLPVSLYVEEVPDYRSTFEEQRQMLQALLGNANANWLLLSPRLLSMMGIRDGEKISAEIRKSMQERAQAEQQASQPMNDSGMMPEQNTNPQQPISLQPQS